MFVSILVTCTTPSLLRVLAGDIEFANAFSCVDPENSSKMLLTTRIKGLIAKGTEVELELLGLKASVELLANVAQLDTDQVPPICLEIAQLCGKLQFRDESHH